MVWLCAEATGSLVRVWLIFVNSVLWTSLTRRSCVSLCRTTYWVLPTVLPPQDTSQSVASTSAMRSCVNWRQLWEPPRPLPMPSSQPCAMLRAPHLRCQGPCSGNCGRWRSTMGERCHCMADSLRNGCITYIHKSARFLTCQAPSIHSILTSSKKKLANQSALPRRRWCNTWRMLSGGKVRASKKVFAPTCGLWRRNWWIPRPPRPPGPAFPRCPARPCGAWRWPRRWGHWR
mmetsp:Transcript_86413/g.106055  ORF Transcript_86413/g.106055 Transcript_86413/m.106055 type:complete len:232 (+) Transcript_86413:538-1233(+)